MADGVTVDGFYTKEALLLMLADSIAIAQLTPDIRQNLQLMQQLWIKADNFAYNVMTVKEGDSLKEGVESYASGLFVVTSNDTTNLAHRVADLEGQDWEDEADFVENLFNILGGRVSQLEKLIGEDISAAEELCKEYTDSQIEVLNEKLDYYISLVGELGPAVDARLLEYLNNINGIIDLRLDLLNGIIDAGLIGVLDTAIYRTNEMITLIALDVKKNGEDIIANMAAITIAANRIALDVLSVIAKASGDYTTLEGMIDIQAGLVDIWAKKVDYLDGQMVTNKSSITVLSDRITSEVTARKDLANGQVEINRSTITQTAEAVNTLVTGVGVISGRLNTAEVDIAADKITNQVTNQNVTGMGQRLTAISEMTANTFGVAIEESSTGVKYVTGFKNIMHPTWKSSTVDDVTNYMVDDTVYFSGLVYRCIKYHTSSVLNNPGSQAKLTYWADVPYSEKSEFVISADTFKIFVPATGETPEDYKPIFQTMPDGSVLFNAADLGGVSESTVPGLPGKDGINGTNGSDGAAGAAGLSFIFQGEFASHPVNPKSGWTYYNTVEKRSLIFTDNVWYQMSADGTNGTDGVPGTQGISIQWKGPLQSPPACPALNWAYRDTDNNTSYIFNGTAWEILATDGLNGDKGDIGLEGASTFTYYQTDVPVGATVNELWFSPTTRLLRRCSVAGSVNILYWTVVGNSYDNTNDLIDGKKLGETATWDKVTGAGKPANNADNTAAVLNGLVGNLAYEDHVKFANLDTTLVKGSYIKTELIEAGTLVAKDTVQVGGYTAASVVEKANAGATFTADIAGAMAYAESVSLSDLDGTLITGKFIKTSLLDVNNIVVRGATYVGATLASTVEANALSGSSFTIADAGDLAMLDKVGKTHFDGTIMSGNTIQTGLINADALVVGDCKKVGGVLAATVTTGAAAGATANALIAEIANDNKFSPVEKQSATLEWNIIKAEYSILLAQGVTTYAVAVAVTTAYTTAYNSLSAYIVPLLSNLTITSDIIGTSFRGYFNTYYTAKLNLESAITAKINLSATTAVTTANTANSKVEEIANDNKLTPSEKQVISIEWDTIKAEYLVIKDQGTPYAVSPATYTAAYNILNGYIPALISSLTTTSDITGTDFRAKFKTYNDAKISFLDLITEASNLKVTGVSTTATDALSKVNNISDDNKLTPDEKHTLTLEWDIIKAEYIILLAQGVTTYTIAAATTTAYTTAYTALSSYIPTLISSLTTTSDIVGSTLRGKFTAYYAAKLNLENAINAKINLSATSAVTTAAAANAKVDEIASDSNLTPVEKQSVKIDWDVIVSEYAVIKNQGTPYSVSATAYTTAYTALSTYITPLLSSLTATSDIVGSTFRTNFKNYYDAKITFLNAITTATNTKITTASGASDQITLWKYPGSTMIDGGDIFSNSITANKIAVGAITAGSMLLASSSIATANIISYAVTVPMFTQMSNSVACTANTWVEILLLNVIMDTAGVLQAHASLCFSYGSESEWNWNWQAKLWIYGEVVCDCWGGYERPINISLMGAKNVGVGTFDVRLQVWSQSAALYYGPRSLTAMGCKR